MIDFQLNTANLVKQESTKIELKGKLNPKLYGMIINVEYRIHKDEFRDPNNPEEPMTLYCIYVPQIGMTYVDRNEDQAMEAMHELFEEDFITHMANKLVDEREKNDNK